MAQKKKKSRTVKPTNNTVPPSKAPAKDNKKMILRIGMILLALLMVLSALAPILM